MPLRAVLFDAGNTLLFLDHPRMAAAVGAALGLPLTGPALAAGAGAAARAMEGPRVDDRARAAAYLETLFLEAGVPAERLPEVRDCLREAAPASSISGAAPRPTRTNRSARLGPPDSGSGWSRTAMAGSAEALRGRRPGGYFDVVVDSTLAGVEKPDPAIFRAGAGCAWRPAGGGALRRATSTTWTWLGARPPEWRPCCSRPPGAPRPRRLRDRRLASGAGRRLAQGETRLMTGAPSRSGPSGRCLARSGCWSPSRASTATTAAPRSSPRRCATPAWRSSTPGCTRRPR